MSRRIVTGVFLLGICFRLMGQPAASQVIQRFNAYKSVWKSTRLCLIFNQDKFVPGDTAWFKAYFLGDDLAPIEGKQKIELNLVDALGESRARCVFNVHNGIGYNQILIPADLTPGLYLATAHNDWMKNFAAPPLFSKELAIVTGNTVVPQKRSTLIAVPEGGRLVGDVQNRVAFHSSLSPSTVKVLDSATRAVVGEVILDAHGLGSLIFTPAAGHRYVAETTDSSASILLPPAAEDGYVLRAFHRPDETTVTLRAACPAASPLRRSRILLVISAHGRIFKTEEFKQGANEWTDLAVDPSKLPPGVAHASLLGPDGNVLASRDIHVAGESGVFVHATMQEDSARPRGQVNVEVSIMDQTGRPLKGEFSISAVNESILGAANRNSLADELALFPGDGFVIDRSDENWSASLDNYLICETRDLPWKEILSDHSPKPMFPFTTAIEKRGVAFFRDTSEPVPDYTQIMFYLQHDKMHYQTFALDRGNVRITLPDIFTPDEFFYMAATRKGKPIENLQIRWEGDSFRLPPARPSRMGNSPDAYAAFASKVRLIRRSYAYYAMKTGVNGVAAADVSADEPFEDVIGGADITVHVPDFVAMPTMTELIREVIPSLYARGTGPDVRVRVNLPEPLYPATGDPVYIIDGIATRNTEFFLSLKPPDLLSVGIVTDPRKLEPFKLMGRNGIVIVQTKAGNMREPLDDAAKLIPGISRAFTFRPPNFSHDPSGRIPDFRSTVYWNPSITTDAEGKASVQFVCSDDEGSLRIRIDGLTADGHAFSSILYVDVAAR